MTQTLTGIIIGLILFGCMVDENPECEFLQAKAQSIREAQGATRDGQLAKAISSDKTR